jgi:hypothetical protein
MINLLIIGEMLQTFDNVEAIPDLPHSAIHLSLSQLHFVSVTYSIENLFYALYQCFEVLPNF